MHATYFSVGHPRRQETWQSIREKRASPPAQSKALLRSHSNRKREFQAALQQAEEQFRASESIGYSSRPLTLFYGLTQACRALNAASPRLGQDEGLNWRAHGHGLSYDPNTDTPLWNTEIAVNPSARDMFSRMCIATRSPTPAEKASIQLGAAVHSLLDYTMQYQSDREYPTPITPATYTSSGPGTDSQYEWGIEVPQIVGDEPSDVQDWLKLYPALRGRAPRNADGEIFCTPSSRGISFDRQTEHDAIARIQDVPGVCDYRGELIIPPQLWENGGAFSPLGSWWLVLYALSMLARYSPAEWMKWIDVNESELATRLEFLLDSALDAVPHLVLAQLRDEAVPQ